MTREEVFSLIQSHLADELEVDPARIDDSTRFKEDLEADSLDLYTLVQELEDSYGVKMSDEQAASILTVGQAVDLLGHDIARRVARIAGEHLPIVDKFPPSSLGDDATVEYDFGVRMPTRTAGML